MNLEEWKSRVADAGCVLCRHMGFGKVPCQLHHIREGQGGAQRAEDSLVVGLCPEHHTGPTGFHGLGKRGFYTRYRLDEIDLLAMTIEGAIKGLP